MTDDPRHPLEIPDDTGRTGLAGWMLESVARSYALRLAALIALLGAAIAALRPDAPGPARVAMVVVGIVVAFALLASQLHSWRRGLQWTLIAASAVVSAALLAVVVRPG